MFRSHRESVAAIRCPSEAADVFPGAAGFLDTDSPASDKLACGSHGMCLAVGDIHHRSSLPRGEAAEAVIGHPVAAGRPGVSGRPVWKTTENDQNASKPNLEMQLLSESLWRRTPVLDPPRGSRKGTLCFTVTCARPETYTVTQQ